MQIDNLEAILIPTLIDQALQLFLHFHEMALVPVVKTFLDYIKIMTMNEFMAFSINMNSRQSVRQSSKISLGNLKLLAFSKSLKVSIQSTEQYMSLTILKKLIVSERVNRDFIVLCHLKHYEPNFSRIARSRSKLTPLILLTLVSYSWDIPPHCPATPWSSLS